MLLLSETSLILFFWSTGVNSLALRNLLGLASLKIVLAWTTWTTKGWRINLLIWIFGKRTSSSLTIRQWIYYKNTLCTRTRENWRSLKEDEIREEPRGKEEAILVFKKISCRSLTHETFQAYFWELDRMWEHRSDAYSSSLESHNVKCASV